MAHTEYRLGGQEVLISGLSFLIDDGVLPLHYRICPAEPDVGIMSSYAEWDADCEAVVATAYDGNDEPCILHLPVGGTVMQELMRKRADWIAECCMEDDSGSGPDPMDDYKSWRDDRVIHGL